MKVPTQALTVGQRGGFIREKSIKHSTGCNIKENF